MPSQKNNTPLSISVPLKQMYSQVVSGFARSAALSFGIAPSDAVNIELIAEECFIYSGSGADNFIEETMFTLSIIPDSEGVLMECRYLGLPLHLRKSFATIHKQLSEDSDIDDISIYLLKSLSDDIQFIDEEKDGWIIKIKKRCETNIPSQDAQIYEPVAWENIEIRHAVSSDVQDIAELTYHTYGVTYAVRSFYKPDQLSAMIADNKVDMYLAIWKGKIIGMEGIFKITSYLSEVGSLMVSPAYRHRHIHTKLHSYMVADFQKHNSDDIVYYTCVTSHARSQSISTNDIACGLSFSLYEAPRYADVNNGFQPRESLLFIVSRLAKPYHWHLYAPSEHSALLTHIITHIGGAIDVVPYSNEYKEDGDTIIMHRHDFDCGPRTRYLLLENCGQDFLPQLRHLTRDFVKEGVLTINLAVNLSKPMPADITENLHKAGYFFTGFTPWADHGWEMVYEYMTPQAFDFENVHILYPRDKELKDYILRDKEIAENTMI